VVSIYGILIHNTNMSIDHYNNISEKVKNNLKNKIKNKHKSQFILINIIDCIYIICKIKILKRYCLI